MNNKPKMWTTKTVKDNQAHIHEYVLTPHYTINLRIITKPVESWLGHKLPPHWCASLKTDGGGQLLVEQEELTPEDLADLEALVPWLQELAVQQAQRYLQLQRWRIEEAFFACGQAKTRAQPPVTKKCTCGRFADDPCICKNS